MIKNDGSIKAGAAVHTERAWDTIVNPGWEEKYIDLSTGVRMCYCEMGPEGGEVILLLHGAGDSCISWSRIAPILAEAGKRVLIPELRGHGKTTLVVPEQGYYCIEDYAADIEAFLEALGIEKADLAGHSCGSLTSQLVAADCPEKIRSVSLIASGVSVKSFQEMTVPEDAPPFDDDFCREWAACTILDPEFAAATYQYDRQLSMDAWRWIINGIKYFSSENRLTDIICPVQIIWGTEDAVFHAEDQRRLKEGLIHAEVFLTEMKGSSHSPHWDNWRDMFAVAELLLKNMERGRRV